MTQAVGRRGRSRVRNWVIVPIGMVLVACLTACGLLGGGSSSDTDTTGRLELSKITVAMLPTVETTPLQIAVDGGFFTRRGLTVDLRTVNNGNLAVTALKSDATIAFASYTPIILARATGVLDVKIITDNSFAKPRTAMLMVAKNSAIRESRDLEHRKIAVSAKNTLSDLMVKSALFDNGVKFETVEWVEMPIPAMPAALTGGTVDAGMMVEPFITGGGQESGITELLDLGVGALQELPFTCFATLDENLKKYPRTMAAFLDGLHDGIQVATSDRSKIEQSLVKNKIAPNSQVAQLINLVGFNLTTDRKRARRDAELMQRFAVLPKDSPLDVVDAMVVPTTNDVSAGPTRASN
jgi:NitT/TauT family transport system substrate-binding protein